VHAMAGDLSAKKSGERGMIASDLMPFIRQVVNRA
jgi:NAD(P)H-hydrate repair Nnr-like enzyme with NAD(P)H-hydrate dehydratase domain